MKKLLCLLLCLMLPTFALAASYTLPEKMMRQMDFGSGFKGTITWSVDGESDWAKAVTPLSGADVQVRAIRTTDGQLDAELFVEENGTQQNVARLFLDGDTLGMQSDLVPGVTLTWPTGGDVFGALLGLDETQIPALYSVALDVAKIPADTWKSDWAPVLEPYYAALEMWLNSFAAAPSVAQDDKGETVMLVRYQVPVSAVKDETVALLGDLLGDERLQSLLKGLMTEQQQNAYLNPNLLYFYESSIRGLAVEGELVLERTMTMLGETVTAQVKLPLPENDSGYTTLCLVQDAESTTFTLEGTEKTVRYVSREASSTAESAQWKGVVQVIPMTPTEEKKALSAAFTLRKIHSTSTDSDTREHDVTTWELHAEPDLSHLEENDATRKDYQDFTPVDGKMRIHFHSKNAQTSPTTLEVDGSITVDGSTLTLTSKTKTTTPWTITPMDMTGSERYSRLTEAQKSEFVTTLVDNAAQLVRRLQREQATPSELPLPESTETDMASATDAATQTDVK